MPSISPISRPIRRRLFAAEYARNGFKAQKAVLAIGLTKNPNSAAVIANRLLNDIKFDSDLRNIMKDKLSAEDIEREIAKVALSEPEKITGADKVKALSLAADLRGIKKGEIPQKPEEDSKQFIAKLIAETAADEGRDPYDVEFQLQSNAAKQYNSDGSPRRRYNPDADPNLAPEYWPSGNLLSKPQETKGLM